MIIKAADLSNASTILEKFFDSIKSQGNNLNKSIDIFRNDSTFKEKFKSRGYDAARNYMGIYMTALNKLKSICDVATNNIISANNSVIKAMEGYSEIDLSKITEIEGNLSQLRTSLQEAYTGLNTATKKNVQNSYKQTISVLEANISKMEKYLKVIKNTQTAYNNAKSQISGEVNSTINSFVSLIGNFCN